MRSGGRGAVFRIVNTGFGHAIVSACIEYLQRALVDASQASTSFGHGVFLLRPTCNFRQDRALRLQSGPQAI